MAERFCNITAAEMDQFLSGRGFQKIQLPNTFEMVYGKIVMVAGFKLSLRVYTAITEGRNDSRAKGADAIRVQLYYKYNNEPMPVGAAQKCLRVKTWQKNLGSAIDRHEQHFKVCPRCGAPMVERERRSDGEKFWGCVTYFQTRCNGKPEAQPQERPTALPPRRTVPTPRKPEPGLRASKVRQPLPKPLSVVSDDPMDQFRIPAHMISTHQKRVEEVFLGSTDHIMTQPGPSARRSGYGACVSFWPSYCSGVLDCLFSDFRNITWVVLSLDP